MRAYIEALDPEKDLCVLAQHGLGIRPECARVLRVLTMLLKKAAAHGLTPFAVGSIMCRCGSTRLLMSDPQLSLSLEAEFGQLLLALCCLDRPPLHKSPVGAAQSLLLCKELAIVCALGPLCSEALLYVQGGPG